MRLLSGVLAVGQVVFLSTVLAQHVHYDIPEVELYVQSVIDHWPDWFNYGGPTYSNPGFHPRPTNTYHHPKPYPTNQCNDYWLENIKHQGVAAFNPDTSYQVFRNVKDFGAKGDGVTDDTAAIQAAISSGNRCAPGSCPSTTITPAVVYFPAGTYLTNSSIVDWYYTQLIGNPICPPTIQAASNWSGGLGVIDGDPYGANGLAYGSTNVFWRQIRNFIIDTTAVPANSSMVGIHWPTAQATSIQNVVFNMPDAADTQHWGLFIESGSGGFVNDLEFHGGLYAMNVGNQQFTFRNISVFNAKTAINQLWDWGWTYYGINIVNCSTGINMTASSVGSITFFDSSITDTAVGIASNYSNTPGPTQVANSLIVENVVINNVSVAIMNGGRTVLAGTSGTEVIAAWGQGHAYTPEGPQNFQGPITPNLRPAGLLQGGSRFYQRSKPQYENIPARGFLSARDAGATGNGHTDDTAALQNAINTAVRTGRVLFVDQGDYIVTKTVYIPAGSKIVGESYSVILSRGPFFDNMTNPQAVVQIGKPGETGSIEWSDMIVSTQGRQRGAKLIEFNLNSQGTPSGMWDVHARVGGFAGSDLQLAECPTTPDANVTAAAARSSQCIAAFLTMHVTPQAAGLYAENVWLWTADHDVENQNLTQITVYAGRGLLIESTTGPTWLVGTAVEHHTLYEYQLLGTRAIFMGQIQTETAYYQPNPPAPIPFTPLPALSDPVFPTGPPVGNSTNTADGWGLRVLDSRPLVYGAGLYSFFDDYSTNCSAQGNGEVCQVRNFEVEGDGSVVELYNLNTVGTTYMVVVEGEDYALYADNLNGFVDSVALVRWNAGGV